MTLQAGWGGQGGYYTIRLNSISGPSILARCFN